MFPAQKKIKKRASTITPDGSNIRRKQKTRLPTSINIDQHNVSQLTLTQKDFTCTKKIANPIISPVKASASATSFRSDYNNYKYPTADNTNTNTSEDEVVVEKVVQHDNERNNESDGDSDSDSESEVSKDLLEGGLDIN